MAATRKEDDHTNVVAEEKQRRTSELAEGISVDLGWGLKVTVAFPEHFSGERKRVVTSELLRGMSELARHFDLKVLVQTEHCLDSSRDYNPLLRALEAFQAERSKHADSSVSQEQTPVRKTIKAKPIWDPYEAGRQLMEKLKLAEGGAYSAAEVQKQWKHSPQTLYNWRKGRKVVFWQDAKGDFFYPKWQFEPNGRMNNHILAVLKILDSEDAWGVMAYFLQPKVSLDARTPLEVIRSGQGERVIEHARDASEQATW